MKTLIKKKFILPKIVGGEQIQQMQLKRKFMVIIKILIMDKYYSNLFQQAKHQSSQC
jgi:hypothetical protein